MAKRPSKHLRPARPLSASFARTETKRDGSWTVQSVPSGRSEKQYLCPGCQRAVAVGASHLVTWPTQSPIGSVSGLDHRRHWHTGCWARRG
ncbi:hypothetical protein C1706_00670 [Propioniciclava flava]|uniref:ATP/GTP-binding protein n=1 Tax=Propioniciclava flava TaxID=2072026 RepID=A0A4Q2EKM2_9ACTN|nr:hypothetical protein C1706_00670 [Propioniciclava flava]